MIAAFRRPRASSVRAHDGAPAQLGAIIGLFVGLSFETRTRTNPFIAWDENRELCERYKTFELALQFSL